MTKEYFKDMEVVDRRLSACEDKLEKLEKVLKKLVNSLEKILKDPEH